jgi:hypothetical protein
VVRAAPTAAASAAIPVTAAVAAARTSLGETAASAAAIPVAIAAARSGRPG